MDQGLQPAIKLAHILIAAGIVAISILAGWLARHALHRLEQKAREKTGTVLDDFLLAALGTPAFVIIVLLGLFASLSYLPLNARADDAVQLGLVISLIAAGAYTVLSVVDAFLRWYAHDVAALTKTSLDEKVVPILRVCTPITGGVLGVLLILKTVGIESLAVNGWLIGHGTRIFGIVVISLLLFFALSHTLPEMIRNTVKKGMNGKAEEEVQKRSDTLATVLVTAGQVVILGAAVLMVLNELIPSGIAPLLAGVGVAGIAIGFGAQSLVKDVITGLFIIMEGQYHVGDVVKIADTSGLVENVNLRRTVLRDLDGIVHFVPNGEIRVASNYTKEYSKVNLNISVAYDTDLDHAIAVLNRVGKDLAEDPTWQPFITKPPQVLRVDNLGDSGIEIKIVGETKPIKQWDVMGELRKRTKEAFDKEGIEIPWPHMKVYFGKPALHIKRNGQEQGAETFRSTGHDQVSDISGR